MSSFSRIDDEKLIELVRKYPVLYDLSNSDYMNVEHKQYVWESIAETLEKDVKEIKDRWGNIRDQFRKSLRKEVTKSGQAAQKNRAYKYKNQLSFLHKTFADRETISNLDRSGSKPTKTSSNQDPMVDIDEDESEFEDELPPNQDISYQQTPSTSNKVPPKKAKLSPYARKKMLKENTSASGKLMEYLISQKKANSDPHPVDTFLAGIAPILKSLDALKLHKARSEIFAVVQKYELDMLMDKEKQPSVDTSDFLGVRSTTSTPLPDIQMERNEPTDSAITDQFAETPSLTTESPLCYTPVSFSGSQSSYVNTENNMQYNFPSDTLVLQHHGSLQKVNQAQKVNSSNTLAPQHIGPLYSSSIPTTTITAQRNITFNPIQSSLTGSRKVISFGTNNPLNMQEIIKNLKTK